MYVCFLFFWWGGCCVPVESIASYMPAHTHTHTHTHTGGCACNMMCACVCAFVLVHSGFACILPCIIYRYISHDGSTQRRFSCGIFLIFSTTPYFGHSGDERFHVNLLQPTYPFASLCRVLAGAEGRWYTR
jgi:hypothetical protein